MTATTSKLRDRIAKLEAIANDERAPINERSACAGIAATLRKLLQDAEPQATPYAEPTPRPDAGRVWADYDGVLIVCVVDGQPLHVKARRADIEYEHAYDFADYGGDRYYLFRQTRATLRIVLDATDASIVNLFARTAERHAASMSISVISETVYWRGIVVQTDLRLEGSITDPWSATITFAVLQSEVNITFAKALPPTRPALPRGS